MIGVDTNVLLRLFVGNDRQQQLSARALFEARSSYEPVYICMIVLLEFVWSLDRSYGYPREEILALVGELLDANDLVIEKQELVAEVIKQAQGSGAGFPDLMIALGNLAAGCTRTVTFDHGAAKSIEAMELLT